MKFHVYTVCRFIIAGSAANDQTRSGLMNDWLSWVRLTNGSSEEGHYFYLDCSIYCYIWFRGPIDTTKDPWTQFSMDPLGRWLVFIMRQTVYIKEGILKRALRPQF